MKQLSIPAAGRWFIIQFSRRRVLIAPAFFILLSLLITYPTVVRLADFAVFATDPLLEAWTLSWNVHSLLQGLSGVKQIWQANIFYPYPATLAFSEHLLSTALLLLPFTLLGQTPMVAANLGVLLTTALSGWGVYLLVVWLTGDRRAGFIAGVFFAVSPFRMGHLIQLHLLSTHWIPFIFWAAARLIKFNRRIDLALLIIFTNLQFFASVNYAPLVALALLIWGIFCLLAMRRQLSLAHLSRFLLFGVITVGLNWPVLRLYQRVSEQMEIVRTLGDAKVYGASIQHYLLPMANSLLYTRWLGLPYLLDSAFPGVAILILAGIGLYRSLFRQERPRLRIPALALLLIALTGFCLSFGANDEAFGPAWASIAGRLLPYPYLYEWVPLLAGLRVPLRFALLPTFALALLAGFGLAYLNRRWLKASRRATLLAAVMTLFIVAEHLPAPLPGVAVPYGQPVYAWLARQPANSVVLELPYYLHTEQSGVELARVYESTRHWQPLVNGASGFEPKWMLRLGTILDSFPDWRGFDLLRHLGVNYLVLHREHYNQAAWANLLALLPGYLPAVKAIHSAGEDLVLELLPPACPATPERIKVSAQDFPTLTLTNPTPATFIANPRQASAVTVAQAQRRFLEPLFLLPGQTASLSLPVKSTAAWQVKLANLEQTLTPDQVSVQHSGDTGPVAGWQPVEVLFANQIALQAVALGETPQPCHVFEVALRWSTSLNAPATVQITLLDRFGRSVLVSENNLVSNGPAALSQHRLPLAETVPPGLYQLQVRLLTPDGIEIPALDSTGTPLAAAPALPLVIRPVSPAHSEPETAALAQLANGLYLLRIDLDQLEPLQPGQWLRFQLLWTAGIIPAQDYTVFTQLIGPDGQVWGQQDNPPHGGWYPTSLWRPGEAVRDDYALRLDPHAPPGRYRLIVGLYDPATQQRVRVSAGQGRGSDFIPAADVAVSTPSPQ